MSEANGMHYPLLTRLRSAADHVYHTSPGLRLTLDEAAEEIERLRTAIAAALESAEEEGVDHHRSTDDPRRFVTILREALATPTGAGAVGRAEHG